MTSILNIVLLLLISVGVSGLPCLTIESKEDFDKSRKALTLVQSDIGKVVNTLEKTSWIKYDGHCYYYSSESTDWFTAERKCRQIGGYLVKTDNEEEKKTCIQNITIVNKIEARVEEQEQYSRRTSLRFHNVPAPTDDKGDIIKPIDTDSLILGICHKQLKLKLDTRDIGRSHPIGEIKDGKISIIVRFLSYRQRQLVFSNKRKLKGNTNKTFIAENLTKHRYNLLHRLNTLREKGQINSFWTHDGSILIKQSENSRPKVVISRQDIYKLGGEVLEGDDQKED
ncbi:CD206 [Mytilus edulis]|uniref:MRC n=1 Tax=Mytilus edulis TaxID=6550 RepID=A0A8S3T8Z5_MYTED|nr:CD206 [Mytilus edulis]